MSIENIRKALFSSRWENVLDLLKKNEDGESLNDEEYFKLAEYWEELYYMVAAAPHLFGKGFMPYVLNKKDETSKASEHRRARAKGVQNHA